MTKLHHAPVAFGLIVGEWNSRVMKESQRVLFARCEAQEEIVSGSANRVCAKRGSLLCRAVPHMSRDRVKSSRPCTDYSLRSLGRRQEQPERPIRKRCKSKVAINRAALSSGASTMMANTASERVASITLRTASASRSSPIPSPRTVASRARRPIRAAGIAS